MPDWLSAPLRGLTYLFLWALVVVWVIAAPVTGILVASNLLLAPDPAHPDSPVDHCHHLHHAARRPPLDSAG